MSIVITGSPGVGKHTIAHKIAEKLKLQILDINAVARDSGLFEEDQEDDTSDVDVKQLKEILRQRISTKSTVVVGHLAPYVLEKDQVKTVIVLRRSPYDLVLVYQGRKYSQSKIKENAASEILGIIAHDAIAKFQEKVFQINTSGKTIPHVAENLIGAIAENVRTKDKEEVDWLELVRKNNDLEKFFVD